MVGSALVRRLRQGGFTNIVMRSHSELELLDQRLVFDFLKMEKPDYVFVAAGKVGGIHANNNYGAEFIYQNLVIEANVIHGAYQAGVKQLCFLGSSCIYPRECPQPIKEEYLLTGPLEPTNEPYAIAKIAGIKLCESYNRQYGTRYLSVMPTNLYGMNDHYDLDNSHVLPALIRKTHEAKLRGDRELVLWGSGRPRREFLHVDDLAAACVFLMELQCMDTAGESSQGLDAPEIDVFLQPPIINIGCGTDISILELANMVMDIIGFTGEIVFDASKPDGTPRKLLDVSLLKRLGWDATIPLRDGIAGTYAELLRSHRLS